ncbi:uncharacterized protein LOC124149381 [Haliotis rufescens]|uniref:uncharacterized protein LOC124149381 n=1 Tax=Haliotis rufescens TaxID=6454 RepID=UPI001EAFB455|nr:uncharacterized protein LOC124149381 [Haliotis rufescens]
MMASPLIILMANAIFFGALSAMMIMIAVSVDAWQSYTFDQSVMKSLNDSLESYTILQLSNTTPIFKVLVQTDPQSNATVDYYLHSSYTGLWRLCDDLTDADRAMIPESHRFNPTKCFTFVTDYNEDSGLFTKPAMQIARLQNSAASCYIVVLIDLVTAGVVGLIGITQKQVASCMVTGVLYCMAALFGVFGLSMFHTKNYYETYQCYAMDKVPESLCPARNVEPLWAIPLAWMGVVFCVIACVLWLIVARALRVIKAKTML